MINGNKLGEGLGYSKKEAEENAARNALEVWTEKTEPESQ
jgi:dsRNA-specific ribonuclease